jgi:protein phosphatase
VSEALKTDKGNREENQDSIAVETRVDGTRLYILCDGMGGHKGGAIASMECVKYMRGEFRKSKFTTLEDAKNWIYEAIVNANNKINELAKKDLSLEGMGTTFVGLMIANDYKLYASVGDSRIYGYNHKEFTQFSYDQTFTNALLKAGYINEKEAEIHPKKNMLLCAVGSTDPSELDVQVKEIEGEYNFLVCSDGLYNMIDDKEICKIVSSPGTTSNKAMELIDLANINGGKDNISVILVEDIR